jgi:hypothetical protein
MPEDDIHVSVTNYDKDTSVILGTKLESLKQNREENTNNIKLLPSNLESEPGENNIGPHVSGLCCVRHRISIFCAF